MSGTDQPHHQTNETSTEQEQPTEPTHPSDLVFMMGEFEARFPTDRRYAKNHVWACPAEEHFPNQPSAESSSTNSCWRFGFTAYAVRLLQDVYFLEWSVDEGATLAERQEIGAIESKKAESQLFSPLAGVLLRFNDQLLADPSAINLDKYGQGWLYEMEGAGDCLLTPQQYLDHLQGVWEVTQRTIKGQLNE